MEVLPQIALNGLLAGALYALIAGGISFLYGTTKIFHLAHGVVVVAGGYAFWWGWRAMFFHPVLAAVFALVVAAAIGVLINELVYEVLRRQGTRGLGYLIATLAILMLGMGTIMLLFGAAPKTFRFETSTLAFGSILITQLQLWMLGISTVLLAAFYAIIKYTRFGQAMRATADNETVAEVLGINTRKIRRFAFLISSVLAASAGILIGLEFNLDPNMAVLLAVKGFAAAVIGGVGSFSGAILGSLLIGFAEQGAVWFWGSSWRNAVTFILLFFFLLFRPSGIIGKKRDA